MLVARLKEKRCKGCAKPFLQQRAGQQACSPSCALQVARHKREKAELKKLEAAKRQERQQDKERKERLKSRSDWMRDAQAAVNKFVRLRDLSEGRVCISCGRDHQGQWHAGHYLSRGAHPELALEPKNIHLQCAPCNTHLSGNQIQMRRGLVMRYGVEFVEWLEGPHEPKKYTIDQLKQIISEFRSMARKLEKDHEA